MKYFKDSQQMGNYRNMYLIVGKLIRLKEFNNQHEWIIAQLRSNYCSFLPLIYLPLF